MLIELEFHGDHGPHLLVDGAGIIKTPSRSFGRMRPGDLKHPLRSRDNPLDPTARAGGQSIGAETRVGRGLFQQIQFQGLQTGEVKIRGVGSKAQATTDEYRGILGELLDQRDIGGFDGDALTQGVMIDLGSLGTPCVPLLGGRDRNGGQLHLSFLDTLIFQVIQGLLGLLSQ